MQFMIMQILAHIENPKKNLLTIEEKYLEICVILEWYIVVVLIFHCNTIIVVI